MKLEMKFTSATGRLFGSAVLTGINHMVGVCRAIAIEYRTAIAAEETYQRLRCSGAADLARCCLRRDQQALVIKSLFYSHEQ